MSESTDNVVNAQFVELTPEESVRFMAHLTLRFGVPPQVSFQMLQTVAMLRHARRMPDHNEEQMVEMMVGQAHNDLNIPTEQLTPIFRRTLKHAESVVGAYEKAVIESRNSGEAVKMAEVDDLMSERAEVVGSDLVMSKAANDEGAAFKA